MQVLALSRTCFQRREVFSVCDVGDCSGLLLHSVVLLHDLRVEIGAVQAPQVVARGLSRGRRGVSGRLAGGLLWKNCHLFVLFGSVVCTAQVVGAGRTGCSRLGGV